MSPGKTEGLRSPPHLVTFRQSWADQPSWFLGGCLQPHLLDQTDSREKPRVDKVPRGQKQAPGAPTPQAHPLPEPRAAHTVDWGLRRPKGDQITGSPGRNAKPQQSDFIINHTVSFFFLVL